MEFKSVPAERVRKAALSAFAAGLAALIFSASSATGQNRAQPSVSTVSIDPSRVFQEVDGFGAALTDSSAWLISRLPAERRRQLIEWLFDARSGAGLSYLRVAIGSSDFSVTERTCDDVPPGQTDYPLARFSIAYDEAYIIPVLKQIMAVNPRLRVMASPWSAPAWMKTNGMLHTGRLKPDDRTYAAFADYLERFVRAYARHKIPVHMLTLQNEPWNEPEGYPSMRLEPEDEARLAKLVGGRFKQAGIRTKIVVWDHNWDHPEYAIRVLKNAGARAIIDGTAFHGYAGDVAAQSTVHAAAPDKNIYFTESTGGSFAPEFGANLLWDMTNLLVGSTRHWAKTVLKWNLALDEKNGPHLPGGPDNCRGVVTINRLSGAVTREEEYYAFAHAAKFIQPGARRVYSDAANSVAFLNRDGTTALMLYNSGGAAQTFRIRWRGKALSDTLPARSVATLTWSATGQVRSWITSGDRSRLLQRQPDQRFH